MVDLDYVVVGHVTRDLLNGGFRVGGTAAYAAGTAEALGCRAGVITSTGPELEVEELLRGVLIADHPAPVTTTFENRYVGRWRQQVIHGTAEPLVPAMVPRDWRTAIVHIGPVAQECDFALADVFEGAFVGLTPQGWMRQWDVAGRVYRSEWREAKWVLDRADAVVLSEEDIGRRKPLALDYAAQTAVLAVTKGAGGCTVYAGGHVREFAPPPVREMDPTGAGDVFAAAFFWVLHGSDDPWAAARFANCLAAHSVTREGLSGVPDTEEVARCRQAMLEDRLSDGHYLRAG